MGFETPEIPNEVDQVEQTPAQNENFVGREKVNGVDIIVEIGTGDDHYELYLPGLPPNQATLNIGKDAELARQVFERAKKAANYEGDPAYVQQSCVETIQMVATDKERFGTITN